MARPRHAYAAPAWAAEQRVGDVGTKATLLVLANYSDERLSCYPGQETIADETEQSVRTVRRQLERLEALGLIKREKRYDDRGKRTSDRYFLQIDRSVNVTVGGVSPTVVITTGHQMAGSDEAAGQEGTTGQIVSASDADGPRGAKVDLADNLSASEVPAGQAGTTGHQMAGSQAGATTGHDSATTGHENDFTTGHSYGRGTPRRTPRTRTPRSGSRATPGAEAEQDSAASDPLTSQARDIVKRYMDWRKAEKGKPLLKSSDMYHALVNEYVRPALSSGYGEKHISNTLAASARDGHEWPTQNAWRRLLDRDMNDSRGNRKSGKQKPAQGNEDHWAAGGSFDLPA